MAEERAQGCEATETGGLPKRSLDTEALHYIKHPRKLNRVKTDRQLPIRVALTEEITKHGHRTGISCRWQFATTTQPDI